MQFFLMGFAKFLRLFINVWIVVDGLKTPTLPASVVSTGSLDKIHVLWFRPIPVAALSKA